MANSPGPGTIKISLPAISYYGDCWQYFTVIPLLYAGDVVYFKCTQNPYRRSRLFWATCKKPTNEVRTDRGAEFCACGRLISTGCFPGSVPPSAEEEIETIVADLMFQLELDPIYAEIEEFVPNCNADEGRIEMLKQMLGAAFAKEVSNTIKDTVDAYKERE